MAPVDRSARRALIAAWLGWMFDGYENYAFVLVMPVAMRQLVPADHLDRVALYAGTVLAATLLGWAIGGVVLGVLTDYIGRKRVLMLSILWYASFSGLTYFSWSYSSLLFFRFLTGLGLGAEWAAGAAIVAEAWPASWRGRAAGALQSAFGVGFFLASLIWFFVGGRGPEAWRDMFLIGILPAVMLLYIRRGVDDSPQWIAVRNRRLNARSQGSTPVGTTGAAHDARLNQFTISYLMSDRLLRRRIGFLLIMSLSSVLGWWSISTLIPQYLGQLAGAAGLDSQRWASFAGLTYNLGAVAGYVVFGILADFWGRKPAIYLYYVGALVFTLSLFLLVETPDRALIVAAANGFFTLGQFSWMTVYLPELFPTAVRGSAISLVFNASRFVASPGPLIAGWVIASTGSIAGPASVMAGIYVFGVLATFAAGPETRGQSLPE